MVRVEEISSEIKVAVKPGFKDVVFEDVGHCLFVRSKHDVNLLALVIRHLPPLVGVESSLVLVVLKKVVFAVPKLPVGHEVSLACRVRDLDSLPCIE